MDYRNIPEALSRPVTKIVSVGMFEHVGKKNYSGFLRTCYNLLPEHGLLLLHSIGRTVDMPTDLWVDRYIFPNSYLPTTVDIAEMVHGIMIIDDWHNFGADYDRTLLAWHKRFEVWAAQSLKQSNPRLYRMWRYYLLTYAGCFRVRTRLQLGKLSYLKMGCREAIDRYVEGLSSDTCLAQVLEAPT
jgi:cyclopropane-fatty-acyl-phospholipid synthase